MTDHDLHISPRLKKLLPPLTAAEKKQLEANLVADGRVIDPIVCWHDGEENIIVDGMHRHPIADENGLPYGVEWVKIGDTYEEAEEWIWNHQAGRRNLSREAIGKWYNRAKTSRGGDHTSKVRNDTVLDTAEHIADKAGTSAAAVKRAGKRVETLEKCAPAVQKAVENGTLKASDADLKTLSKLPGCYQKAVTMSIRKGLAKTVKEAIKRAGITAPAKKSKGKPDYGKCPSCAGTKWNKTQDGVSCARCNQPHGEPAGDPEYAEAIPTCKELIETAKGWK